MNILTSLIVAASFALAPAISVADSDVDDLSRLTGAVIAAASAKLSEHQRETNASDQRRAQLIASVVRQAAEGQQLIDKDLLVLKNTGGAETVKLFNAMREYGDQTALASTQLDGVQAAALADAITAIKPLSLATERLDAAAKGLGQLGSPQTSKERLALLRDYLHDTRAQIKTLEEGARSNAVKGDAALATTTKAVVSAAEKAKPSAKL